MARYAQRGQDSKIIGFSSHPNILTDSVKIDEDSQEWLDYLTPTPLTRLEKRIAEYPSVEERLDDLFNKGAFSQSMADKIQTVNDTFS